MYATPPAWCLSRGFSNLCQWLDFILAKKKIPQTISTSYGDDEQTGGIHLDILPPFLGLSQRQLDAVPTDFARRVCWDFAQLGAFSSCCHLFKWLVVITWVH
jgi:hypothetical protein